MFRYFDIHFHLDLITYNSSKQIVSKIEEKKIYVMAVTNLPDLFEQSESQVKSNYIRICLGFHPELVYKYPIQIMKMWENLDKTRYVGEVGLDFSQNISDENKNIQLKFLKELVLKCEKYSDKILSIHSRQAEKEILEILKKVENSKIIMHWYTGPIFLQNSFLEKGFYFSVNKSMTRSLNGKRIIKNIPLNRILLESDLPFVKYINEEYGIELLEEIIIEISKIKNVNLEKLKKQLFENFKNLIM